MGRIAKMTGRARNKKKRKEGNKKAGTRWRKKDGNRKARGTARRNIQRNNERLKRGKSETNNEWEIVSKTGGERRDCFLQMSHCLELPHKMKENRARERHVSARIRQTCEKG